MLRDDGNGGAITTQVDSATLATNPNIFEHTVTLSGFTGKLVRFQLQVSNEMGTTTSTGYLTALVAGLPGTPANILAITSEVTGSQIAFTIPETTDDGGSSIETYQVMVDDGAGGDFTTISGYPEYSLQTNFVISSGIQMGSTYRVMYSVKNKIGWATSGITYILAAQEPSMPGTPVYVSSSSTSLVIEFGTSESNGGDTITGYTVQIDKEDGNGYVDLTTYTPDTTTVTLTIDSTDATKLKSGSIYRFRSYAVNSLLIPSYSYELRIAAAQLPSQPSSGPTWQAAISSKTSIGVSWTKIADTELPTTGYKLYRDGGNDGQFTLVYDGTHRPGQLSFVSSSLTTGTFYRFKYLASNFNGDGPLSDEVLIPACLAPQGLSPPSRTGGTSTTIILEWTPPTELNGCQITGFNIYQGTSLGVDNLLTAQKIYSLGSTARSQTITYASTDTGNSYVFQLEATNAVGSVKSGLIEVTLAGMPAAPTAGPTLVASQTNTTQITVE